MKKLVFVTGNDNKAREAAQILGVEIERVKIDLDELQSMDLKVIVEHKAKQAYRKLKKPVIVEDVALNIDAWKGFPGPFSKFIAQTMGYDGLATMLTGSKRTAAWVVVYGYFDGRYFKTFEGVEKGAIAREPAGSDGWGFDTVFIPAGYKKTVAELGEQVKNKQSARYLALRKLKAFLDKL